MEKSVGKYQLDSVELNLGDDDRVVLLVVLAAVQSNEGGKVEVVDVLEGVAKLPPLGLLRLVLQVGNLVAGKEIFFLSFASVLKVNPFFSFKLAKLATYCHVFSPT